MAEHVIEIVIGTDGKIKGEVKGVKGAQCGPLLKWLDELGAVEKLTARRRLPQAGRSEPDGSPVHYRYHVSSCHVSSSFFFGALISSVSLIAFG
jgi:5-enolpyruvylshikimate-3-phosphate synthase